MVIHSMHFSIDVNSFHTWLGTYLTRGHKSPWKTTPLQALRVFDVFGMGTIEHTCEMLWRVKTFLVGNDITFMIIRRTVEGIESAFNYILGDWKNYAYKFALKIEINNKYWFLSVSFIVEKYFDTLFKSPFEIKKK